MDTLASLTKYACQLGTKPEYIQGGGGNVSLKIGDVMHVKASGKRLDELTVEDGYVAVAYEPLREFYQQLPISDDLGELIQKNDTVVQDATVTLSDLRPSIETGFHAILGPVVLHTHSVYTNLLMCSEEGTTLLKELFPEAIFVPYNTPGIALTYAIQDAVTTKEDAVVFLENHGVIVSGTTIDAVFATHETISATIQSHFRLSSEYPSLAMNTATSTAHCPYLTTDSALLNMLREYILFPDQVVYGEVIGNDTNAPVCISPDSQTITYQGSATFTQAALETVLAWSYLMRTMNEIGLTPKTLSATEGIFIANLDSEKYRKQQL